MIKANASQKTCFPSETKPKRPLANKSLDASKSCIFFATMRGLANFTVALSPKDSEFLCTFKLTTEYSSIAQSVERRTVNQGFSGSSRGGPTPLKATHLSSLFICHCEKLYLTLLKLCDPIQPEVRCCTKAFTLADCFLCGGLTI